jgi:hypothetical protein
MPLSARDDGEAGIPFRRGGAATGETRTPRSLVRGSNLVRTAYVRIAHPYPTIIARYGGWEGPSDAEAAAGPGTPGGP